MTYKRLFSLTFIFIGIALIIAAIYLAFTSPRTITFVNPLGSLIEPTPPPKPLLAYSFNHLATISPDISQIRLESPLATESAYTAYLFSYATEGKRMTGQLNMPQNLNPSRPAPVVLLLRGFVDPSLYQTGIGTKNAAAFFASRGFVTIAPDFLGFGGSDPEASDSIAARLQKPRHVIDLIASLSTLDFIASDKLSIWAHSNGGQIALSVLEITGKPIPTTLWAPVTKSFPYSILYYTDETPDQGKALRQVIADFEADYDVFDYSIDRYWDRITAPLQLHQGTVDDAVPLEWSNEFVATLTDLDKEITYHVHPGADHNLQPAWSTAIQADLTFFESHLD